MRCVSLLLVTMLVLSSGTLTTQAKSTLPQTLEMQTQETPQVAKVKAELHRRGTGQKTRVKVTLHNKTELKGYVSKIDEASFEVTEKKTGHVTSVPCSDVEKIGRPGLSKAAKIKIVIGVAVVVAIVWLRFAPTSAGYAVFEDFLRNPLAVVLEGKWAEEFPPFWFHTAAPIGIHL